MERHYSVGIDPGKTGAVAVIRDDESIESLYTFQGWTSARFFFGKFKNVQVTFGIENIHAAGGNGSVSSFSFAKNCGGWDCFLELEDITPHRISVQSWQPKILGKFPKGESKKASVDVINKKYPHLNLRYKDHGIADALCLALYVKKYYVDNASTIK